MAVAPTLDRAAAEYLKARNDVHYFIRKYCKIKDENTGAEGPFEPFAYQDELLDEWIEHRLNVDLKARQLGISWLACGFALWMLNFYDNITILCISKSQEKAYELISKIKFMYNRLPEYMRKTMTRDNQGSVVFAGDQGGDGSRVMGIPSTPGNAVGYTATLLIVDEWGEQDYAEELYGAYKPTIDMGGRMIGIGTGNQIGSFYHEIWSKARKGENGFHAHFLGWWLRPGRDQDWYDRTRKSYPNLQEFLRQYPNNEVEAFVAAGGCPFSIEDINWYMETYVKPFPPKPWEEFDEWNPKIIDFIKNGELLVWEKPLSGFSYLVTFDPAAGLEGRDYHGIHVLKLSNMEQVAEFQSRCDLDIACDLSVQLSRIYNTASPLVWDNVGIGNAVTNILVRSGYPQLYEHQSLEADREPFDARDKRHLKLGWPSTRPNNHIRDAELIAGFRDHSLIIHSERWLDEAKGFVRQMDGTYGSSGRAHDDLVKSLGMGFHVGVRLMRRRPVTARPVRSTKRRKFRREIWR